MTRREDGRIGRIGRRGMLPAAAVATALVTLAGCSPSTPVQTATAESQWVARPVEAVATGTPQGPAYGDAPSSASVDRTNLPRADPWAVLPQAPKDPAPNTMPPGLIVTPPEEGAVLYDAAGGEPFAILPAVPYRDVRSSYAVVAARGPWLQVMLNIRRNLPSTAGASGVNGGTGWVLRDEVKVTRTTKTITVYLSKSKIVVRDGNKVVASSDAGTGKESTPTPVGRTFVWGIYHDPGISYTPYVIALGDHSPTMDSFGGGPAPIAIHAFTSYTGQVSNGCIRVPVEFIDKLKDLPVGIPVLVHK